MIGPSGWRTPRGDQRALSHDRSLLTDCGNVPGAMNDRLEIRAGVAVPLSEILLRVSRSSGPGGQHANVTASRVQAVFDVRASAALSEAQKARIAGRLGPARDGLGPGHPLPATQPRARARAPRRPPRGRAGGPPAPHADPADELLPAQAHRVQAPAQRDQAHAAAPLSRALTRRRAVRPGRRRARRRCGRCRVLDALGVERAHLPGSSWGARLGFGLGEHAPERMLSLVLSDETRPAMPLLVIAIVVQAVLLAFWCDGVPPDDRRRGRSRERHGCAARVS